MAMLNEARRTWLATSSALGDACRALSSVPGAAAEYEELCALADRVQAEGRDIVERAIASSKKQAIASLPESLRG